MIFAAVPLVFLVDGFKPETDSGAEHDLPAGHDLAEQRIYE